MRTKSFAWFAVFLLLASASLVAQYSEELTLGRSTLLPIQRSSLALTEATPLRVGLRSARYARAIGGVTFESTASASWKRSPQQLELQYLPSNPDGQRFWVVIDGRRVLAPIYDWQLLPIARFADSKYTSCFTLLGDPKEVNDEAVAEDIRNRGGRVVKFHPALKNTLLGLRLFQLDILLISDDAPDLPRRRGEYLLGRGESAPDVDANQDAASALQDVLDQFGTDPFSSYIINDQSAKVRISTNGELLVLSGDPAYHTFHVSAGEKDPPLANRALNRWLAENRTRVRAINPAVWDSGINTVRYAAFFRYCKANYPESWRTFLAQIGTAEPTPKVQTPDVYFDPNMEELARLRSLIQSLDDDKTQ
jgi:hypothetical protein